MTRPWLFELKVPSSAEDAHELVMGIFEKQGHLRTSRHQAPRPSRR